MSDTATAQVDWVKTVLGFDIGAALRGGGQGMPSAKGPFGSKKSKGTAPTGTEPEVKLPKDKDLAAKFKTYADEVKALKDKGFDTKAMEAERADLAKQGIKAEGKLMGRDKAIAAVKTRLDEEIEHVRALAKSLKDEMGTGTGNPSADQKSKIYKKALEEYYGLDIEVPPGMTNTHFDKMFDMFGSVPKGDVKQDKLKKLKYNTANIGGLYWSGDCKIEMGDFGDAGLEEDYQLGGKTVKANSFNVTTLHEIGHSVDTKHGIMTGNQSKPGCGGWKQLTLDEATAVFAAALLKSAKFSKAVTEAVLTPVVKTALKDGTTVQPSTIANADWTPVQKFLIDKCLPARDAAQPFFKDTPVVFGDRAYTESQGTWYSYGAGARKATKVNLYQWRSPPEWFAEVYAITWLKKKPPPSGVDATVAKHCWKG